MHDKQLVIHFIKTNSGYVSISSTSQTTDKKVAKQQDNNNNNKNRQESGKWKKDEYIVLSLFLHDILLECYDYFMEQSTKMFLNHSLP